MRSLRSALTGAAIQVLSAVVLAGAQLQAQGVDLVGDRGPRFLLAPSASDGRTVPLDVTETAVLRRPVRLDFDNATIKSALAALSAQSGVDLVYSDDVLPRNVRVTLHAQGIAVAAALTHILLDARVDVVFLRNGTATLRKQPAPLQVGSISGRVTDATTQQGIEGVRVFLEGTRRSTTTSSTGGYRLSGVAAGAYTLMTRRLGYSAFERAVTVEDGREITVDVALQPVPSALDEVIVTVTGNQRLRELGHVVGRINADSLVREAPVASLSELLTARVPGLQVFQGSGVVGGNVTLQIRGPNSLLLSNEPVVIIDGIRYTSRTAVGTGTFAPGLDLLVGRVTRSSPLNHINVNDIESIEVVKGPSASTLYGTDAANGVIVITTKRGKAGPPRWNAYAHGSTTATPKRGLQDAYWGWGTVFGTPSNPNFSCTLDWLAAGLCSQRDSIGVLRNAAHDAQLSVLGAAPRWAYGMNVAGGPEALRYYVSADFEDATGPIQMPPALVTQLLQERGLRELPEEWRRPNAQTQLNLRTNLTAALSPTAELHINAGYVHGAIRSLRNNGGYVVTPLGPNVPSANPAEILLETSTEQTERVFGSGSGDWRAAPWLTLRATVGLDINHAHRGTLTRRGDRPSDFICDLGCVFDERLRQLSSTADVGATATVRTGPLTWRTSAGAQHVRLLSDALGSQGSDLTPGGTSIVQAAVRNTARAYNEAVTLGAYVEETVALNNRLFLTGALRVDGASTFGEGYKSALYPKMNVSWLVSEEPFVSRLPGLDALRLRYAFGGSGQQPDPRWAGPEFFTKQGFRDGRFITVIQPFSLGNPELRPERVREQEFGFDATALRSRVSLELTWTRRRVVDQIVRQQLPPGLGQGVGLFSPVNLGLTTQRGFEGQLRARLVESRFVSWDATLQHSEHRTRLEDLGGGAECFNANLAFGCYREGYSLGAQFHRPIVESIDVNGDGIINPFGGEIQVSDTLVDMGLSAPPRSQTLTTALGFFGGRLRLSAVMDRHTGFTQQSSCNRTCRAAVDPLTPLEQQALALDLLYRPADYTRLQEVSVAMDVPRRLTSGIGARSTTLVISARNLALWSDSNSPDPGAIGRFGLGSNYGGIPLGRTWGLRLNVGF